MHLELMNLGLSFCFALTLTLSWRNTIRSRNGAKLLALLRRTILRPDLVSTKFVILRTRDATSLSLRAFLALVDAHGALASTLNAKNAKRRFKRIGICFGHCGNNLNYSTRNIQMFLLSLNGQGTRNFGENDEWKGFSTNTSLCLPTLTAVCMAYNLMVKKAPITSSGNLGLWLPAYKWWMNSP